MFALKIETDGTVKSVTLDAPDLVKVTKDPTEPTFARFVDSVTAVMGSESHGGARPVEDIVMVALMADAHDGTPNPAAAAVLDVFDRETRMAAVDIIRKLFGEDAVSAVTVETGPSPVYGPVLVIGSLGNGPASLSLRRATQVREVVRSVTDDN